MIIVLRITVGGFMRPACFLGHPWKSFTKNKTSTILRKIQLSKIQPMATAGRRGSNPCADEPNCAVDIEINPYDGHEEDAFER
mmetsp:Transcript_9403/g.12635  ORF Transcript_9403/g.12635 Transcript_9403/m.12635 type:complete len:83 (-) Transcript_9403:293-541(-)